MNPSNDQIRAAVGGDMPSIACDRLRDLFIRSALAAAGWTSHRNQGNLPASAEWLEWWVAPKYHRDHPNGHFLGHVAAWEEQLKWVRYPGGTHFSGPREPMTAEERREVERRYREATKDVSVGEYSSPEAADLERLVRRGWRAFACDECGHKWEWPSRDRFSPSGENCPKCGEWLCPCGSREDESLPVDDSGNLKIAWNTLPNEKSPSTGATE